MPRLMSVAMTADAVIERQKIVTRRLGWWEDKNGRRILRPGDRLTLCRKVQGRKPGEPLERLAEVEVITVWREPLAALVDCSVFQIDYSGTGFSMSEYWEPWRTYEMCVEGFPGMDPADFVRRYFVEAQGVSPDTEITRIGWRYLDREAS